MTKTTLELGVIFPFPKENLRLAKKELRRQLLILLEEFDTKIIIGRAHSQKWWEVKIICEKEEKELITTIIRAALGLRQKVYRLKQGTIIMGRLVKPKETGFGWFIDVGLIPRKDALLPLFAIRRDLFSDIKAPLREITDALGFFDKVPLQVKVTKIDFRKKDPQIEVELTQEWVEKIMEWVADENEWLIIWGTSREKIIHALKSAGHYQDITGIDSIDTLDHIMFLKKNTRGTGLIPRLGPHLRNAVFGVGSAEKINEIRKKYQ